jgi:hypothetical protein
MEGSRRRFEEGILVLKRFITYASLLESFLNLMRIVLLLLEPFHDFWVIHDPSSAMFVRHCRAGLHSLNPIPTGG